ncbi:hypothetical protein [Pseudogemmobacter sonorensis]|uniref:hypothetical protein n=1 Tax=Pseudogemmobacter sonorensis TaxID=2989681 RepID=UPI0036C0E9BF
MSEPLSSHEIEDVLSSIRRLVSEELRPGGGRSADAADSAGGGALGGPSGGKLLLTPALRVVEPVAQDPAATGAGAAGDEPSAAAPGFDTAEPGSGGEAGPAGGEAALAQVEPPATQVPEDEDAAAEAQFLAVAAQIPAAEPICGADGPLGIGEIPEADMAAGGAESSEALAEGADAAGAGAGIEPAGFDAVEIAAAPPSDPPEVLPQAPLRAIVGGIASDRAADPEAEADLIWAYAEEVFPPEEEIPGEEIIEEAPPAGALLPDPALAPHDAPAVDASGAAGHWSARTGRGLDWAGDDSAGDDHAGDWADEEPAAFAVPPLGPLSSAPLVPPPFTPSPAAARPAREARRPGAAGVVETHPGTPTEGGVEAGLRASGLFEADETLFDEKLLREIVREIIREELAGTLGERITRNVRKLVRVEVNRALTTRDLD